MYPDFLFGLQPYAEIEYDIETYPNVWTCWCGDDATGQEWYFEISGRRNDLYKFCLFLETLRELDCRMVGFNSIGFDYPVIHFMHVARDAMIRVTDIYDKAMSIIKAPDHMRFSNMVWESDHLVKQIDLFKVHHFDNKSKSTSLKVLEFNMRMENVEDLPFDVGTNLTFDQIDVLAEYNRHDRRATSLFKRYSKGAIALREKLSAQLGMNLINCSDVKIGEKILIHELEKAGVKCYEYVDGRKRKRQTQRDQINLAEVVFPYIRFDRVEFDNIHKYFLAKTIRETNGVFADLVATVDGLDYKFGTGGLHASVESSTVVSDDRYQLVDVDVASFYPNLGIKNRLFPAHLGEGFCDAYHGVFLTRKEYPKGTAENEAYKLALNGAYGNSNNQYSPFFDPQYTMSITINGQLLLCMLAEQLLKVPGLKMIQANTDGITYLCPREYLDHTRNVCRWWESFTHLELEEVLYKRMFIRDVNSYIAEKEDGKVKRIGAYAYETAIENPGTRELPWHKDWSARVVPMAAEAALVRGVPVREFITAHSDVYDFLLRTKVPRNSSLEWGGEVVANTIRYYVSTEGRPLEKVMPPGGPVGAYKRKNGLPEFYYKEVLNELIHETYQDTEYALGHETITEEEMIAGLPWDERINTKNRSTYQERRSGIHTGWPVQLCNNLKGHTFEDLNYEWYIKEAEKLVEALR